MPDVVAQWCADRLPTAVTHLDVAGCGRVSRQTHAAVVAHLLREAEVGGYVAEAEAVPAVDAARGAVAALLGLGADDLAFTDGAATAFAALLAAWPLGPGARVGTVGSEYGTHARVLARLAAERGWTLVVLDTDPLGRVVEVPTGLDLLSLPQVPSQRGVVQPVADLLATGVPVLLDVAQSLGQTTVPTGCAAYVGTSRKWLCGPRGVGFAVVDPAVAAALSAPPTLAGATGVGMARFDGADPHLAGRVGLGVAAAQWHPDLLAEVAGAAERLRATVDGAGGWRVVEPVAEPSGITTLVPPPGVDPVATLASLRAAGVVASAIPVVRAADLDGPVLRLSTAAWVGPEVAAGVAALLAGGAPPTLGG